LVTRSAWQCKVASEPIARPARVERATGRALPAERGGSTGSDLRPDRSKT
jgi:hypothetical protein